LSYSFQDVGQKALHSIGNVHRWNYYILKPMNNLHKDNHKSDASDMKRRSGMWKVFEINFI
jgi:hypothetical protein